MKEYKQIGINLIKKLEYIIPLLIVTIASYGYLLTHSTVNVDVLSSERYFKGEYLIAQKRLMGPILERIFGVMDFYPFFADFIAVLLLIMASILFCILFYVISNGRIKIIAYTIFSCSFISYPLMMQVFPYVPMGISIGLGFCLVAISLIAFQDFLNSNGTCSIILSMITLWCSISLYESFATVYIMGVLSILLIKILFVNEKKEKLSEHVKTGLKYLIPLIIAILFNIIISTLILKLFNINQISNADKTISYLTVGISNGIKHLIHTIIIEYFIIAFGYLPFTILLMTSIASLIIAITISIKKKDISILVIVIGMNITLLLLSIIKGMAAPYRACQQFPIFIGGILMILTQLILSSDLKKYVKNIFIFFVFLIILYQVKDIYLCEYVNDLRYQREKLDVIIIGNEIVTNYNYKEKPVIFFGNYELPKKVREQITIKKDSLHYKILNYYNKYFLDNKIDNLDDYVYPQTSIKSYINWGMYAFMQNGDQPNIELIKFFNLLGYDIKASNLDLKTYFKLSNQLKETLKYSQETSILETEDYILVYF